MTATAIGSYATTAALKALIGTTDSDDDAELGLICDRVNQWIESETRQPIVPLSSAAYTYDGNGLRRIFLPMPLAAATLGIGGARAISLLEIAPYTFADFVTIASTDYSARERFTIGGPFRWLMLGDRVAGAYRTFPKGTANVRVTMTAGWPAIPDDLTETALVIAQRAWNARAVGQQDVSGTDETGRPIVARYVSGRDKATIQRYSLEPPY
jgi:hypothetical protein